MADNNPVSKLAILRTDQTVAIVKMMAKNPVKITLSGKTPR
jgi:hypothetical protein